MSGARLLKLKLDLDPALSAHLITAERLEERQGHCPTGVAALDALLAGGWPRGALSEIYGRRSSGRTSVLLASLGAALMAGHAAALVDTDGALDPRSAAAAGVPLAQLLWVRAGAREALKAADLLLAAGGFGLVALDLGEGRARIPSAAWVRLKHAAERQGTAVLVAAPRCTVGAFAAAAVNLRARGPRFYGHGEDDGHGGVCGQPPLLAALETAAEVTRRRKTESIEGAPCAWLVFSCPS
jgi:hypothetical protein